MLLVISLLLPLLFPDQITLSGPCTLLPPPRPLHPPKLMFPPMLLSHPRLLHAPRLLSPPRLLLYPRLLSSCPLTLPGCFPSQVISRQIVPPHPQPQGSCQAVHSHSQAPVPSQIISPLGYCSIPDSCPKAPTPHRLLPPCQATAPSQTPSPFLVPAPCHIHAPPRPMSSCLLPLPGSCLCSPPRLFPSVPSLLLPLPVQVPAPPRLLHPPRLMSLPRILPSPMLMSLPRLLSNHRVLHPPYQGHVTSWSPVPPKPLSRCPLTLPDTCPLPGSSIPGCGKWGMFR